MLRTVASTAAIAGLFSLLAAGCVVAPPATDAAQPASSEVAADAGDGNQVVCRDYNATASRVRRERVCMTAKEWDAVSDDAEDLTRSMQSGGSMQPGGANLPGR